ncbi:MAG: 4'-phosphopantetheinyl transferase superfamily protein [Pseudomonadota bacterium]|nr:4'-phosphopantetheinyl transferase superfamily protein [Pseudomonadota bacterium]
MINDNKNIHIIHWHTPKYNQRSLASKRYHQSKKSTLIRNMVRQQVAHRLDRPDSHVIYQTNPQGKPSFIIHGNNGHAITPCPIHFSISHSHDISVFVLHDRAIGIDIEYPKTLTLSRRVSLMKRCLQAIHPHKTVHELLIQYQALPPHQQHDILWKHWTYLEAFTKLKGQTLWQTFKQQAPKTWDDSLTIHDIYYSQPYEYQTWFSTLQSNHTLCLVSHEPNHSSTQLGQIIHNIQVD